MLALVVSAASVFLSAAFLIGGQMMLSTDLSLRMAAEGLATSSISLVLIHYSFGFMLGSWFGPRIIRRVGHIRAFSAFAALTCSATLLQAAWFHPVLWAGLRAGQGFCASLLMVVLESWVNAHATPATRGRFMSLYMINYYVAGAGGQLLVGLHEPTDFRAFSLCAGLLVLSMVPLCLTRRAAPTLSDSGHIGMRRLYEASRISVFGAMVSGFVLASFYQLSPIYMRQMGETTHSIATYMACAVLGSMLLQYPLGQLADRYDRRKVIFGIALGIAFAGILVATLGHFSTTMLYAGTMLYTGTAACLYPACLARLNDRTRGQSHVAANATLLLCFGVGQCIGPLTTSAAMSVIGPHGLYLVVVLVVLGYAAFAARRIRLSEANVQGPQQKYVAMPADATPIIAQLDPRAPAPEPPTVPGPDRLSTP